MFNIFFSYYTHLTEYYWTIFDFIIGIYDNKNIIILYGSKIKLLCCQSVGMFTSTLYVYII